MVFPGNSLHYPEALGLLRQPAESRNRPSLTVISACDPLNLGGLITPGAKTPAVAGNRILLEHGIPVARCIGEELEEFSGISDYASREARKCLLVVKPWRYSVSEGKV